MTDEQLVADIVAAVSEMVDHPDDGVVIHLANEDADRLSTHLRTAPGFQASVEGAYWLKSGQAEIVVTRTLPPEGDNQGEEDEE